MAAEFKGFNPPTANYSKLPHQLIDALPLIETESEMKVILYILRHTWGFQDEQKKITLDEFKNGRKRRDGSRIDNGVGMSIPSIRNGLERARDHGFITIETDDSDKARVKKFYSLTMNQGEKVLQSECKKLLSKGKETLPRSEKETSEKKLEKETPSGDAEKTAESLPDPLLFGLDRQTLKAREREGEWTVPNNGLVGVAIKRIYERLGSNLPKQDSGTWQELINKLAPVLADYGIKDAETVKIGIDRFHADSPKTFKPFYKSFPGELGIYLSGNGEKKKLDVGY